MAYYMQTYPATAKPSYSYGFNSGYNTMVSEFEGEGKQATLTRRFPKREFSLLYNAAALSGNWLTLHNFFTAVRGGAYPFWYFDFAQRNLTDLYVGRGGPYYLDCCFSAATGGTVFTDQTDASQSATTGDMTLLPAAELLNDAYYFGSRMPFSKLTLQISQAGLGSAVAWQYSKANGTWASLVGISDGTSGLTAAAGSRDVTHTPQADWSDLEVNNVVGLYWVKVLCTSALFTQPPKASYATVSTTYYDLPSKSTTNDASLITYVNGTATAKTFVSGGGGGSSDRFYFGSYPAAGSLITADLQGYLRMKASLPDQFESELSHPTIGNLAAFKIKEW